MNKYIKRPLPNVEDAKHAIDCMIAGCSEDEFYNKYTPQMVTTNEFYQIRELENHIKPDAKVLTVCASGEQPLFFKLYGAKNILIGPEGGFSDTEFSALDAGGARGISLGKTILRAELAGVVAISRVAK